MLRKFLSIAAAALLISVILLTPASSADTGEATILYNNYHSWPVEMNQRFMLSYSIATTNRSLINVMVIPEESYFDYLNGSSFVPVVGTEARNITNTTMEIQLSPGIYYILAEANDRGDGNITTVSYRIDARPIAPSSSSLPFILGAGVSILLAIVVYFVIDVKGRKEK
jgi:hypothetical protein